MKFVINIDNRKASKGLKEKLLQNKIYLQDMLFEDFKFRCGSLGKKDVLKLTQEESEELEKIEICAPEVC